jgi:hypothetical protein
MPQSYSNQQLQSPVVVQGLLTGQTIATVQAPFLLSEVDFVRLRGNPSRTETWATNLFFAVVGYAVSLGPKFVSLLKGEPSQITSAEWITLGLGAIVALVLYLIGFAFENERKDLMKRIATHFKNAPASHHVVKSAK